MSFSGEVSNSIPISGTMIWYIDDLYLEYKGTFSEEGFF